MYAVCNASCYSGEILEVSAFFVHSNSPYRRWIGDRVMGVEDSFRKRYKPYARVVWEVDSLEKDMKCNRTVTVIGVAWDEKEPGVFRRKHQLRPKT